MKYTTHVVTDMTVVQFPTVYGRAAQEDGTYLPPRREVTIRYIEPGRGERSITMPVRELTEIAAFWNDLVDDLRAAYAKAYPEDSDKGE